MSEYGITGNFLFFTCFSCNVLLENKREMEIFLQKIIYNNNIRELGMKKNCMILHF